ncbi:16080_t:CDS:2 [Entrophospora sp. SA101]|nr:16080_t:CDS:2 [Entrophospora sp. SA101]CAJ0912153.1 20662_t:CDS:2 [Entrophospora sp. SA101]
MSSRFYKNEINLLLNDEETYCKERNISENEYHQLRRKLIQKHKVKGIKASDLLINLSPKLKLSTGCNGEITEISGNIATGKTQIGFSTLISALCSDVNNTVLYIDTKNIFSALHIQNIYYESDRFIFARDQLQLQIENLLGRIRVVNCSNIYEVLEVLEDVGNNCKVPSDYFYPNLRLIIIDNIFSIISTILSDTCQVSANPDNPVSMFSPTRKPALGINWSIFPDVELFLSFAGDVLDENGMPLLVQEFEYFNNNGLKILMKPRICELLKSRNEGEYEILTPDYYLK